VSFQNHARDLRNRAPLLLPHLLERIRDVESADLFAVLEFQELIAAVTSHVNKYVRPVVR